MRKHILTVWLATLATMVPGICQADGNELLKQCAPVIAYMDDAGRIPDSIQRSYGMGYCLGLAQGITNMNLVYQYGKARTVFCLPTGGIENGQAVRVIVKWLQEHPERLHEQEGMLAVLALVAAFPCPSNP